MQWNQIKSLFIIFFLVLDVYLLFQFFNKQKEENLSVKDDHDLSIEKQLAGDNIKISDMPDEDYNESYITVRQHVLTDKEKKSLNDLPNQNSEQIDGKFILSTFNKPVPIPDGAKNEEVESLVGKYILHPEEYTFWSWDKKLNVLLLFQKKNDRPVYFNQNGMVVVFLNDKNEMVGYTQAMLAKPEKTKTDKKKLIKPIKAVETLYKSNQLTSGDEVTKAELVFYTRIPLRNGVQVFVPTWKIAVNNEKNFYVNAIEGFAIQSDEKQFMKYTVEDDISRIQRADIGKSVKGRFLDMLIQRQDTINRSEEK